MYFVAINIMVFIMGVLFSCFNVWAGPQLKDIKTFSTPNSFEVSYIFAEDISKDTSTKLEFINETVQLDIGNLIIPEGKRFSMVSDEKVRNLYTYQVDPETLRLRIIYKSGHDANSYKGNVNTSVEGNTLKVSIADGRAGIPLVLPEKEIKKEEVESSKEVSERVAITNEELEKIFQEPKEVAEKKVAEKEKAKSLVEEIRKKVAAGASEEEIPLLLNEKKEDAKQAETNWYRLLISLLVVLGAGGLIALLVRKFLTNKSNKVGSKIKVITQHHLGPKKSLGIIRVAGEFILIGITDHNINHIKTLSILDEDIPEEVPDQFDNTLSDYQLDEELQFKEEDEDSFAITGIKDIVSKRLKGMRQI